LAARPQVNPRREFRPSDEECRALLERIFASREFQRATRLREFLSYVVERKLAGQTEDITEILIGHRVFGRTATYNSGDDSIVRTEARTLRQRLERYFAGEGAAEAVVIEIPRGGYQPVFHQRAEGPAGALAAPDPPVAAAPGETAAPPGPKRPRELSRRQWIGIGIGAPAVCLAAAAAWRGRSPSAPESARSVFSIRFPGLIHLESSDPQITAAFSRSKQRALSCVYTGDPVGDWYATSPAGRSKVFCMRDVAHQSVGASALGLARHTANMLRRFAQNISRSRHFCSYWTITKDGFPAPETYRDDTDFGYSLPANFDVMRACYHQLLWTGDSEYLNATFSNFYDRTVIDYVKSWDHERVGIMENAILPRVSASYHSARPRFLMAADLVAAQYAGYATAAAIEELKGIAGSLSQHLAQEYKNKAAALRAKFNSEWWDASHNRFYSGIFPDHTFDRDYVPECDLYALWFGIPEDGPKTEATLDNVEAAHPNTPGAFSHLPDVLYQYGRYDRAQEYLMELADPDYAGQEVAETAFAVVGAVAAGMMGLSPDAPNSRVETLPRLSKTVEWVKLSRIPVMANEISVEHHGLGETVFTNGAGPLLHWKAAFPAPESRRDARILFDGVPAAVSFEQRANRQPVITATVPVQPGQTRTARYGV